MELTKMIYRIYYDNNEDDSGKIILGYLFFDPRENELKGRFNSNSLRGYIKLLLKNITPRELIDNINRLFSGYLMAELVPEKSDKSYSHNTAPEETVDGLKLSTWNHY